MGLSSTKEIDSVKDMKVSCNLSYQGMINFRGKRSGRASAMLGDQCLFSLGCRMIVIVVLAVLLFLNKPTNVAKVSRETRSLHYKRKKEDTRDDL